MSQSPGESTKVSINSTYSVFVFLSRSNIFFETNPWFLSTEADEWNFEFKTKVSPSPAFSLGTRLIFLSRQVFKSGKWAFENGKTKRPYFRWISWHPSLRSRCLRHTLPNIPARTCLTHDRECLTLFPLTFSKFCSTRCLLSALEN